MEYSKVVSRWLLRQYIYLSWLSSPESMFHHLLLLYFAEINIKQQNKVTLFSRGKEGSYSEPSLIYLAHLQKSLKQ